MKKCPNCGAKNSHEDMFCTSCASSLEGAEEIKRNFSLQQIDKKYLVLGGAVLALILVIILGSAVLFAKSPGAQVLMGAFDMITDEKMEGHVEVSIEVDDSTMGDLFEEIKLVFDFQTDKEDIYQKSALLIKDQTLFEVVVSLQHYIMYVDLLDLYDEPFYFEDKAIEEAMLMQQQLRAYAADFSLKGIDVKKYVKLFEDEMGKDLYKEKGKVVLELDEDSLLDLMEVLLEEAEDDDDLKEVVHRELIKMFEAMIEDDFEMGYMDDDMWEEALEELEDFKDFEDYYEEAIEMMLMEVEWAQDSDYKTEFDLEIAFDFSLFNKIKSMDMTLDIEKEVALIMAYEDKSQYKFKNFDEEEGVDLEDLFEDEEEMFDVGIDILMNLAERIEEQDEIVEFIEDTELYEEFAYWYDITDISELLEMLLEEAMSGYYW